MKIVFTVILVAYVLLMIVGAIIPNPQDVPIFSGNTKYFHFLGFLVLSMMVLKTLDLYSCKHKNWISAVLLAVFIFLTEFLQLFVSTRHYSYWDMLIDLGGCILGWGLYKWIYSKR
jgi:VanZ family protein